MASLPSTIATNRYARPSLWCDTSTAPEAEKLNRALGNVDELIRRTGNAMGPGYTAPKILWLKENEPKNFTHTRTILLPHDFLNFWLPANGRWNMATPRALDCSMSSRGPGASRSANLSTKICLPSFRRVVPLLGRPVCCAQPCANSFSSVTSLSAQAAVTPCPVTSAPQ